MNRFKVITSSYLLYIKDRKILLLRRFQTGYEDGKYGLPAGHVDEGETLRHCLCRECKEEIGVTIEEDDIDLVHVMHRKGEDIRVDFFWVARRIAGEPKNMEPEKCDDLSWFPLNNLPSNTIPYIRAAIENYQNKVWYSEFGWKK